MYEKIPTFDPQTNWKEQKTDRGWYQTDPNRTVKATTVKDWKIVAPANEFQKETIVKEVQKQIVIGYYDTVVYTTSISPKEKSDMLKRTDKMLTAIEATIRVANDVQLVEATEASKVFDFINNGIV